MTPVFFSFNHMQLSFRTQYIMNSRNQELHEFENDGMESNESTSFIAIANFYSQCSKTSVIRIFQKKNKRK